MSDMSPSSPSSPSSPLRELHEEARGGVQPPFVVFVADYGGPPFNVHAAVARARSGLVRTAQGTQVGAGPRQILVPGSASALKRAVGWMYGAPLDFATLAEAVETLSVATYLDAPKLKEKCMDFVETSVCGIGAGSAYELADFVSLWLMFRETAIDGPVELVRSALVRMLMAECVGDGDFMKNPAIARLIERTTLADLARLASGLPGRPGMCANLAIEFSLAWRNEHGREPKDDEDLLAHINVRSLPPCYISDLVEKGRLSEAGAKQQKRQKRSSGFGSWTGRVDGEVCAVELCGPTKLIVAPLRGFPFDREGKAVHTPQVVRVGDSYLTFPVLRPFLRSMGDLDYTHPDSDFIRGYDTSAFLTGYVLADGADGADVWRRFGIVPPFMGDRSSRFAAAAPSHATLIYFVKMCGPGADCAVFDIKTCTWAQLPPLMNSRQWPCIAMSDEYLYVVGGGQTERLCITRRDACGVREWEAYGPCVPLTRSAAVFVCPFVYVLGGACPETGAMSPAVTRVSTLDGSCVQMPPMIEPRMCHGSFAEDGRICVIGGMDTYHRRRFAHAEALDTKSPDPKWCALEVLRAKH